MTHREKNTPETALDDEHEALRILGDRSHRHGAYLCLNYSMRDSGVGSVRFHDLYKGPRIVVQYLGGWADMEVRSERVTYVTERVVSIFRDWTRGTLHWGYTDEYQRHISEHGERVLHDLANAAWALGVGLQRLA